MKNNIEFDGFSINTFIDEDGCWIAHFIELPHVSAGGESVEEAISELKVAWELVKEEYKASNTPIPEAPAVKEFSGRFNVRIDKRDHKLLAMEAASSELTLNALIALKLHESVNNNYSDNV